MSTIALVVTDLQQSRLGLPSLAARPLAGKAVLARTLQRVARVPAVERIVVLHPAGQEPLATLGELDIKKPIDTFADPAQLRDPSHAARTAARKWALSAWRGGLGGMTCYDELLPAGPIAAAIKAHGARAALLVGGDWCLVDPELCQGVLELQAGAIGQELAMAFNQAPPGLSGLALSADFADQLAEKSGTVGYTLAYHPTRPQADPIGRDVCQQIDAAVRGCGHRLIYDTPRSAAMIDDLAARLGDRFDDASALEIANAAHASAAEHPHGFLDIPQQVTLELTPRRPAIGPITPQHHVTFDRPDLTLDDAKQIFEQLGAAGDVALTLGGLGDALEHPQWAQIVQAARDAGVMGICVETDLLTDHASLEAALNLPIDVLSVRLNADRAATYEKVMGVDGFKQVADALGALLKARSRRTDRPGTPWIVPRLIKTAETIEDMESFFDRWVHFAGHALIEPPTTGGGLMPDQSLMPMAPPRRRPCPQLRRRATILSNGAMAQCDQDWLGEHAAGNIKDLSLPQLWENTNPLREAHARGDYQVSTLCANCACWHRP